MNAKVDNKQIDNRELLRIVNFGAYLPIAAPHIKRNNWLKGFM